jgi:hypothetical protein
MLMMVAGCKDRTPGDCVKIVDHMLEIGISEDSQGMSPEQKDALVAEKTALREQAIDACKKRKLSKQHEECALAATTVDEMNACK